MKKIITLAIAIALTGCVTTADINLQEARINTNVKIAEYNSIANKYLDKATFATASKMDTLQGITLKYKADAYATTCTKYGCNAHELSMVINTNDTANVLLAIDKYMLWSKQATANKESITKDIIQFTSSYNSTIDYKYGFHSGNANSHYLTIATCGFMVGCTSTNTVYLDKQSVLALKEDVTKLANDGYNKFNIESNYN